MEARWRFLDIVAETLSGGYDCSSDYQLLYAARLWITRSLYQERKEVSLQRSQSGTSRYCTNIQCVLVVCYSRQPPIRCDNLTIPPYEALDLSRSKHRGREPGVCAAYTVVLMRRLGAKCTSQVLGSLE